MYSKCITSCTFPHLVSNRSLTRKNRWSLWSSIWFARSHRFSCILWPYCRRGAPSGKLRTICRSGWRTSDTPSRCSIRWMQGNHCSWLTICASTAETCFRTRLQVRRVKMLSLAIPVQILPQAPRQIHRVAAAPTPITKLIVRVARGHGKLPWRLNSASWSKSTAKWSRWLLTIIAGRTWPSRLWKNSSKYLSHPWRKSKRFTRSWPVPSTSMSVYPWSLIIRTHKRRWPSSLEEYNE